MRYNRFSKDTWRPMTIRLKLLRKQKGWTLDVLADETGLTKSYLSKVERGLSVPSIAVALKLSKALNVDVEQLFSESHNRELITVTRAGERTAMGAAADSRPTASKASRPASRRRRCCRSSCIRRTNSSRRRSASTKARNSCSCTRVASKSNFRTRRCNSRPAIQSISTHSSRTARAASAPRRRRSHHRQSRRLASSPFRARIPDGHEGHRTVPADQDARSPERRSGRLAPRGSHPVRADLAARFGVARMTVNARCAS